MLPLAEVHQQVYPWRVTKTQRKPDCRILGHYFSRANFSFLGRVNSHDPQTIKSLKIMDLNIILDLLLQCFQKVHTNILPNSFSVLKVRGRSVSEQAGSGQLPLLPQGPGWGPMQGCRRHERPSFKDSTTTVMEACSLMTVRDKNSWIHASGVARLRDLTSWMMPWTLTGASSAEDTHSLSTSTRLRMEPLAITSCPKFRAVKVSECFNGRPSPFKGNESHLSILNH